MQRLLCLACRLFTLKMWRLDCWNFDLVDGVAEYWLVDVLMNRQKRFHE